MSALHDTALAKHGQSAYKLGFISEDLAKAVQAKLDADAAAVEATHGPQIKEDATHEQI